MATPTANRLLKPEVLARLGRLDLIARTVVDGVTTGLHRSPHFGFSQEFAEYRAYNEGDDLRYVDWNVYARTDRTYIKRFQGETNTAIHVLLDASASMGFGEPVSKLEQARFLAASLAYVTRKQHDSLGMTVFDEIVREHQAPSARPDSLPRALALLEKTESAKGTDILDALTSLRASVSRRGLLVVVSDLYANPDDFLDALHPLAHSGQDIAVFQILDVKELEPDSKTISAFKDLETQESVIVDPEFLKTRYRSLFSAHCESIEKACRRVGADYTRVLTTEPLDAALQAYMSFRERRAR